MLYKNLLVVCILFFGLAGQSSAGVSEDYEKIRLLYVAGNYPKVIPAATRLLPSENISQTQKANLFTFRGVSFNDQGDYAKGLDDLSNALALSSKISLGEIHYQRYFSYLNLDRMDEAYKDMLFVAENYPDEAQYFKVGTITRMVGKLQDKKRSDDAFALLYAFHKSKYVGEYPLESTDYLYFELARELMLRKNYAEAEKVVAGFTLYSELLKVRTDLAFEKLWSRNGKGDLMDINDFTARELEYSRKLLTKYPKSWDTVYKVVSALKISGHDEEALALARSALAKPENYEFDEDSKLWLMDELSSVLIGLGKFEEANAVLEPLMKRKAKEDNRLASLFINYGAILLNQGAYEKAMISANKAKGFTSEYGTAGIQYVNACALYRQGSKEKAGAILDEMLVGHDQNLGFVIGALLCLERTDTTAKIVIEQLDSDKNRNDVLVLLQDCRPKPHAPPLAMQTIREMEKVRQRPDVQAALTKVGVVISVPVACDNY